MRSDAVPDLSSLALLARQADADLRPLLLRIHTQTFLAARGRNPFAGRDYEAIALDLIPLVTDDVVLETARMLRAAEDAPRAILRALAGRLEDGARPHVRPAADGPDGVAEASRPGLGRNALGRLVALRQPEVDLALARNGGLRLDGRDLAALVDRARGDAALARALLPRPELGIGDRAVLHRFATRDVRVAIRAEIADHLRRFPAEPLRRPGAADRVRSLAPGQPPESLAPFIRVELRLPDWECDLDGESGGETFVLALRALSMEPEQVIALLLGLDWGGARSVPIVFDLAALARETSPAAAACLLGADDRAVATAPPRPAEARDADRGRRTTALSDRRERPAAPLSASPQERAAAPSVLADHRSRSTRGRDRT